MYICIHENQPKMNRGTRSTIFNLNIKVSHAHIYSMASKERAFPFRLRNNESRNELRENVYSAINVGGKLMFCPYNVKQFQLSKKMIRNVDCLAEMEIYLLFRTPVYQDFFRQASRK